MAEAEAETPAPPKVMPAAKPMVDAPPTDAELALKQEAENAKTKLIEEIQ